MRHPKAIEWENQLKEVFDRIDHRLEVEYGGKFPLHPNREPHGSTANPEYDGLFNIGAAFSPGFGSMKGSGYVVDVRMATLAHIPATVLAAIYEDVVSELRNELPKVFPGRSLKVERDGAVFKIVGDLDLGTV